MKQPLKGIVMILGVIILLCLVISIPPVGNAVAKVVGKPVEVVMYWVRTVLMIALAIYLVSTGIAALAALPILGGILIVGGLIMLGLTLYPMFKNSSVE